jgi:hypothetical protein
VPDVPKVLPASVSARSDRLPATVFFRPRPDWVIHVILTCHHPLPVFPDQQTFVSIGRHVSNVPMTVSG